MKQKKQGHEKLMLLNTVLFTIACLLNGYVSIRDGRGLNMVTAGVFLVAAVVWFGRWRRAREEERAPTEPLDPENEPPEKPARFWPWGGLWGR